MGCGSSNHRPHLTSVSGTECNSLSRWALGENTVDLSSVDTNPQKLKIGEAHVDLGEACVLLNYIEALQSTGYTSFSHTCIKPNEPNGNISVFFREMGLLSTYNTTEMHKELEEYVAGRHVQCEYHEADQAARKPGYINTECMYCVLMNRNYVSWCPHWSVPPGPSQKSRDYNKANSLRIAQTHFSSNSCCFVEYLEARGARSVKLLSDTTTNALFVEKTITGTTSASVEEVRKEIALLKNISHPHIGDLVKVVRRGASIFIYTAFQPGGMLYKPFSMPFKVDVVRLHGAALLGAVSFLHQNGIVHNNIKHENVLTDRNGGAVLVDVAAQHFGSAGVASHFPFACPAVHGATGPNNDIWALAVLFYMMSTGRPPFPLGSSPLVHRSEPDWCATPPAIACLLRFMFTTRDGSSRVSANECISHPFFTGYEESSEVLPVMLTGDEVAEAVGE